MPSDAFCEWLNGKISQETLRYAGDHYSFTRWGMYVGVEPDGYTRHRAVHHR